MYRLTFLEGEDPLVIKMGCNCGKSGTVDTIVPAETEDDVVLKEEVRRFINELYEIAEAAAVSTGD